MSEKPHEENQEKAPSVDDESIVVFIFNDEEEDWDSLPPSEKVWECIESGGGLCNDFECVEGKCPYWLGDGLCKLLMPDEGDEDE